MNGAAVERAAVAVAAVSLLAACAPRGPAAPAPAASHADPDFLAPPAVLRAEVDPTGAFALAGRAAPRARVALASPSGERVGADADGEGAWTLVLAPSDQPRAFALTAQAADGSGAPLRGEGAVLATPGALAPVTVLRAGAPAWPVEATGRGLRVTGLDWDGGGGAAVSGFAAPGAPVRLSIDGLTSGAGVADAAGRFGVLWLGAPVVPGAHRLAVSAPDASVELAVALTGPAALAGAPVRVAREPAGWRVDWAPPGGGVQSHLALPAPPAPAPPPGRAAS